MVACFWQQRRAQPAARYRCYPGATSIHKTGHCQNFTCLNLFYKCNPIPLKNLFSNPFHANKAAWLYVLFTCFQVLSNHLFAQSAGLGSWNTLQVKYQVNKSWSAFAEAQLRSLQFYKQFHYYEYKAAAVYKIHPEIKLTLGAGSYQTYKEGGDFKLPKNNNEFRIWPQLSLHQQLGNISLEQRYRSESRFTSQGYRNRFRYRIGGSLPLALGQSKRVSLHASNELFFTDREPYFERNRLQVALGFKVSRHGSIQLGYLHQFDYKINDETGRDFLQIGYYLDLKSAKNTSASENRSLQED